MMVVTAILGGVLSIFFGILASVQKSMSREESRTDTMNQARLAMEAIDRQVRSASVLFSSPTCSKPTIVATSGANYPGAGSYRLTTYTRNAFTASPNSSFRWVQYAVAGPSSTDQTLWSREHPTSAGSSWTAWRSVATGIVNGSASTVPFALDTSTSFGAGSASGRESSM